MIWSNLKQKIEHLQGVIFIAPCVAGLVIVSSFTGIYQTLEWSTLDRWFRLRPQEAKESRIVVVNVGESDISELGEWPISDGKLAQLLTIIKQQQPRAIGLDIYRDLKRGERAGQRQLEQVFQSTPNLIGVEKVAGERVKPPLILKQKQQVAMSDLLLDPDGKVRRSLVSTRFDDGAIILGLGIKLALMYLEQDNITLQAGDRTSTLNLGKATFTHLQDNEGGYIDLDTGGYQTLLNFRGEKEQFLQTSLTKVLQGDIPPDLFRGRIVMIGATAPSLNDLFQTPYNSSLQKAQAMPGVYVHANIASQTLSAALDGRHLLTGIPETAEWLWILAWSFVGSSLSIILLEKNLLQENSLSLIKLTAIGAIVPIAILFGSSYLIFLNGIWIPAITPLVALGVSSFVATGYYHQHQKRIAFTDGLTKIPNRRFFDRYLEQQWSRCQREAKDIALILCDVDFFKVYNDTYGHQQGDRCLQKVALALHTSVRKQDLAARYGGEEFVVVLPNSNPKTALIVANRIRSKLKSMSIPHEKSQASKYVSISMGIASSYHNQVISAEELIATADKALYEAKKQGRDRAVISNQ